MAHNNNNKKSNEINKIKQKQKQKKKIWKNKFYLRSSASNTQLPAITIKATGIVMKMMTTLQNDAIPQQ